MALDGCARTETDLQALRVLAENIPGVKRVRDTLFLVVARTPAGRAQPMSSAGPRIGSILAGFGAEPRSSARGSRALQNTARIFFPSGRPSPVQGSQPFAASNPTLLSVGILEPLVMSTNPLVFL